MKKGNLIFIVGGLGLLYYYFMRKKNPIPVTKTLVPSTTNVPTQTNVEAYVYPEGLYELDTVANGVESAQLYQGQLRPYTAAYAAKYLPNSWPTTKIIPQIIYASIPRGAVLDV
jgi:asparagine N-glycosylation enzyme membrane subunit Stt3